MLKKILAALATATLLSTMFAFTGGPGAPLAVPDAVEDVVGAEAADAHDAPCVQSNIITYYWNMVRWTVVNAHSSVYPGRICTYYMHIKCQHIMGGPIYTPIVSRQYAPLQGGTLTAECPSWAPWRLTATTVRAWDHPTCQSC